MAKQTVYGPYRVKPIDTLYEVVQMEDNFSDLYEKLRPRCTYPKRQSAYAKCVRLNRRWQKEHVSRTAALVYWQEATN